MSASIAGVHLERLMQPSEVQYPILDFRALWSLGYAKHVDNTTYVLAGREIDGGHLIGGDARRNFVLEQYIAVQRAKVVVQEQPGVLTDARDHRATERIGRVPDHDLKWPVAPLRAIPTHSAASIGDDTDRCLAGIDRHLRPGEAENQEASLRETLWSLRRPVHRELMSPVSNTLQQTITPGREERPP